MKRLAVLAILLLATRAQAAPADYAEGEKLYKSGRYLDAAEKFRAAYEAEPDPNFLLDAAQAYRFGEDCEKAADYYRRYLDKVPDAPDVKTYIAEQDACAKRQAAAKPVPVEKPVVPDEHPAHRRHTWLYVGIGSAVVGLAAIALGYYEDSKLDGIVTRRSAAVAHCTSTAVCSLFEYNTTVKPYDELAAAKQRNGIIGYSVGGLGLAFAVYLIVSDATADEHAPVDRPRRRGSIEIVPTRTGAMAFGTWAF